jgi:hypothetical protein
MKLTMVTLGFGLALAATPALAQLAGSGNLVSTASSPPTGPSSPHQSTTMVNGGVGKRAVIYGVNGGDLAPGVNTSDAVVTPSQVSNNVSTKKSAGFWVETGADKGSVTQNPTVRANISNNTGAGPSSTFRSADVNVPNSASSLAGGNLAGVASTSGSGVGKNLTGNLAGNLPTK